MAYRNGTYVAFHADGTNVPIQSDIRYYNLIKVWTNKTDNDFYFINSHEKNSQVRDTSKKETLKARLKERLRNSKNMVLILGKTTKYDDDWIPFEIEYAVDQCKLPIIVTYINRDYVIKENLFYLPRFWPIALKKRIKNKSAFCVHIPFKKIPLMDAIEQYNVRNPPPNGTTCYSKEYYRGLGINV